MAAPAQIGVYLAVLRKHWLLLVTSAALVIAAGVFYVVRQEKVFSSSATLVIEAPTRAAAGAEYADLLFADQQELLTQVHLLKENPALAAKAIAKLRERGVGPGAGRYTEESLPERVKVEPIAGTRAWSFTLTGPDRDTLDDAVNAYAEVFQEWSESKTAKRSERERDRLQSEVDEADRALRKLQDEQAALVDAHKDLNLAAGQNVASDQLRALQQQMPSLDADREEFAARQKTLLRFLEQAGLAVDRKADVVELVPLPGDRPLAERLLEDEHIAALDVVGRNPLVAEAATAEREARERDRKLESQDYVHDHPERKAARAEQRAAYERRGRAVKAAIEVELNTIESQLNRLSAGARKIEDLSKEAARAHELQIRYDKLGGQIQNVTRELTLATDKLRAFQNLFASGPEGSGAEARAPRRILLETPATVAIQVAPKVPLVVGLTAFAAVAVGLGLVLLIEYLDDTIKSREDFDRYVGLPFLGFIPRIDSAESERPDLAADGKTGSAIAEAFRAVRTSILFSRSDKPVRTILVTSAGPGEGKTTVATNLALTLARHKAPVLLIDGDLRRPRVATALGLENKTGLTNFLVGEATLDQVVQETSVPGLFAIVSGPIPPNPAELLHGERLSQLVATARERFDRIVIDSPPLIAVSDARVIARCADGLYLVVSMGKTSWRLIQRSLESLTTIGCEAHGAILNNLAAPTGRYGYYYYRDHEASKAYYVQKAASAEP